MALRDRIAWEDGDVQITRATPSREDQLLEAQARAELLEELMENEEEEEEDERGDASSSKKFEWSDGDIVVTKSGGSKTDDQLEAEADDELLAELQEADEEAKPKISMPRGPMRVSR